MGNRKNIVVAAVLAMLTVGVNSASADSLNNLLQMDVKKSSVADTVDVTFFTTGESGNSVVTRKSNNRYVVLLPNISSSSSVAPSIGGVKDLITDIDVKHVNDGIGGYTKVTFGTTKPINIKTYMKKTNPLTQAQKDTKAIIAKNITATHVVTKPAVSQTANPQSTAQKTVAHTTPIKPQVAQNKPNNTQKASAPTTPKIIPIELPKLKIQDLKPKVEPKKVQAQVQSKPVTQHNVQPKAQPAQSGLLADSSSNYAPKVKFDSNGRRIIDLEPRVLHNVQETSKKQETATAPVAGQSQNVKIEDNSANAQTPIAVDTPQSVDNSVHFPIWILIAGGSVLALGVMYLVFDALANSKEKDKSRLQSFFNLSAKNQAKRRRREYYDIANNDDLNWQEKYKMYVEREEKCNPKTEQAAETISYVTDMSGMKKSIKMPELKETQPAKSVTKNNNFSSLIPSKISEVKPLNVIKSEKSHEEIVKEKLQAKISQMEHALSQTPTIKEPEEVSLDVKSEDDAIMNNFSEIKLKSFSKSMSLKQTHRTLADEDKKLSRNKSYKEGRFVKLKNSPLSVTRRHSGASDLEVSDLIETGNKYLTNNNGEMKMNKENENYLLSSLDEYLSILDSEDSKSTTAIARPVSSNLSHPKTSMSDVMRRSGVTNPIAQAPSPMEKFGGNKPLPYMNGLIVKSGYNIDSEKGFYVVNMDGVSALVGRIKDNIFILKKFDHVVDKAIQVRPDDNNVYIVRVGKFKCLVDVSKDKMGTLIEI